jgi:hypothetical protein
VVLRARPIEADVRTSRLDTAFRRRGLTCHDGTAGSTHWRPWLKS